MNRLDKALRLTAIFALLAMGAFFLQLMHTAHQLELATVELRGVVAQTGTDLHGTSQNLNAILVQTGLAANEARLASMEQRSYLKQLNRNINRTFARVDVLLARADQTVAQLGDTTQHVGGDVHSMSLATVQALNGIPPVLEQANQTLAASQKVIADPNIPKTLAHVEHAADKTAQSMDHIEQTTEALEKKAEQLTKPVSWVKRAVTTAASIIGKLFF